MATSGSTDFNSTRNDIIFDALRRINVIGENEVPSAYDLELAARILNRMMKAWEADGIHLWTKSTAIVFLQKDQREYELASDRDHASTQWWGTTLNADAAIGDVSLTVVSTAEMTIGDYIGIEQDTNNLFWSTIDSIPDSTTVVIDTGLNAAASSGNQVWNYTTRLDQPVKIYSAAWRDSSNRDVPMNELSYQGYFELPNKDSGGIPVSYNFDRQRDYAVIRVWSVPQNVDNNLIITFSRKIQDFDAATNNPDLPQEWQAAVVSNLAKKLAGWYGKTQGPKYAALVKEAQGELAAVIEFDNEGCSVFLTPTYEGEYY